MGHFLFTCSGAFAAVATLHSVTDRQTDGQTDDSIMQPITLCGLWSTMC